MNPAAESWLKQSAEDLRYARSALRDRYFAWACFACQQSAEKALKAVLVERTGTVQKTHRLLELARPCEEIDRSFAKLRPALDILNQYYGPTRYADLHGGKAPYEQYTKEIAREALRLAEKVLRTVGKSLGKTRRRQR